MALLHQVPKDQGFSTRLTQLFGHKEKSEGNPVKVALKQADQWPRVKQNPLTPKAKMGMATF